MIQANLLETTGQVDPPTVRHLTYMAKAMYGYNFHLEAQSMGWKAVGFHSFGPVEVGIAERENYATGRFEIFLFFRGTRGLRDLLIDAMAWKDPQRDHPGRMHFGFRRYHEYCRKEVLSLLLRRDCRSKPVTLVGHSLGGFEAIATAQDLVGMADIYGVFTFGSPRGFDDRARDHYATLPADPKGGESLWNVTHRFVAVGSEARDVDLVSRIPPRRSGYRHVGRPYYLGVDGTVYAETEIYARTVGRLEILRTILHLGSVRYHSMSTYTALPYSSLTDQG